MFVVKVLGSACAKCKTTQQLIEEVTRVNAIPITLEKITDIAQIMAYGVMTTPAVVVNEKLAHVGSVPDKKTILSWFKASCCPADNHCC